MKVYKSRRPDIDIPQLDILSLLFDSEWCLAKESTKVHVEAANANNSITKADARVLTKRIAYILRDKFGVGASGPGKDHVLTVLYGSPFAPVFFYGLVAAGGVFCGASTDYRAAELMHQVEDAKANLLVCSPDCEAQMVEAARLCNIPTSRVLILDSSTPGSWSLSSVADRVNLLAENSGQMLDWQRITTQRELEATTICLLYSSGTTGLPKGVKINHWCLIANNVCTMDPARRYKAKVENSGGSFSFDTIAHLPMSNIAGISLYATNPFYMGGTTYWMKKYDFDSFVGYHRKYRPAYQFSVPPIWLRIAKSDTVTDHFDHLQVGVTGSAPVGFETMKEVRRKLGGGKAQIAQTWGATECAGVITALDWPAFAEEGTWNVGELCPNVTLRVLDENDNDVEEGQPGELLVGGAILAQGYHDRPDATRETFVDGFYRSGDIGVYENGFVTIMDRKKELIKYKGAQIAPAELEALLNSHPKLADACVIGVWDEAQQTEVPRAYVVRQPATTGQGGNSITEREVADFVKSQVAPYKQLRGGIYFINEIPKSASGKILRKELRAKANGELKAKL